MDPLHQGLAAQFSHGEKIQLEAIFNKIKKTFPEIDFKKNEHLPLQTILIKFEGNSQRFNFEEMSLYGNLISKVYLTMISGQEEKKELYFTVDVTSYFPQVRELIVGTFKIGEAKNISQRFRVKYEVRLNREPNNEDLKRLGILSPKHAVGEMKIKVQHLLLLSYSNNGGEPTVMKPSTNSGQPGEDGEYSLVFLTEEQIHQGLEEKARLLRELREARTERRNRYAPFVPRAEVPRGSRGRGRGQIRHDEEDDRRYLSPAVGQAGPIQLNQIQHTELGEEVRGLATRVLNLQQQGQNLGEEINGDNGMKDQLDNIKIEIESTIDKLENLEMEIGTMNSRLKWVEDHWAPEKDMLEREVSESKEEIERCKARIEELQDKQSQTSTRMALLEQENNKMGNTNRGINEELREVKKELKRAKKDQENQERNNQLMIKARLEEVKNVERSIRTREDKLINALVVITKIENWMSMPRERHTSTPTQRNIVEPEAEFLNEISQIHQDVATLAFDNNWREPLKESSDSSIEGIEEKSSSQNNQQASGVREEEALQPQTQAEGKDLNSTSLQYFSMRDGDTPPKEKSQQFHTLNKNPQVGDMREDDVSPNASSEEVPVNFMSKEEAEDFIFNKVMMNLSPPLEGKQYPISARISKVGLTVEQFREQLNRRIQRVKDCQAAGMQESQCHSEKAKINFLTQAYLRNFPTYKRKTELGKALNDLIKEINKEYEDLATKYKTDEERGRALEREYLLAQKLTEAHPLAKLLDRREDQYLRSEPGLPLTTLEEYKMVYSTTEENVQCQQWHWRPSRKITKDFVISPHDFLKNWED